MKQRKIELAWKYFMKDPIFKKLTVPILMSVFNKLTFGSFKGINSYVI